MISAAAGAITLASPAWADATAPCNTNPGPDCIPVAADDPVNTL